ncbi:hypothetical protein ACFSSA_11370 [Luteolibacter algae]|uniref:Uncharacterized protein n=1 Tax=Luteolibacter algae TaxID=454151 RepID=A0ABW5DD01_9BACT
MKASTSHITRITPPQSSNTVLSRKTGSLMGTLAKVIVMYWATPFGCELAVKRFERKLP